MTQDRDHAAASLLRHLDLIKNDLNDLALLSRGWQPTSRARQVVQMLQKDLRQMEARATALLGEVGHMDAVRNQFTGRVGEGTRQKPPGSASQIAVPKPTHLQMEAPPSVQHQEPELEAESQIPEPLAVEAYVAPAPPPPPEVAFEESLVVEEIPEPPPADPPAAPPSQDSGRRKLDSMASGLPRHVLEELRKAGLE